MMINYIKQKLIGMLILLWVRYNFKKRDDIFSRMK